MPYLALGFCLGILSLIVLVGVFTRHVVTEHNRRMKALDETLLNEWLG